MKDAKGRARRRIDRAIDKFAEDVGYAEMEMLLQQRAQDMREQQSPAVTAEDIEGWRVP